MLPHEPAPRHARLAAAACAVAAFAVIFWLGRGFSKVSAATYDEPLHLSSGYLTLRGFPRPPMALFHPLLCEAVAALPLLPMRPATMITAARTLWYDHASLFLYKNAVDAERLLEAARLWSLAVWSALLLVVVVSWSAALGGLAAGASAAVLLAFFPPWISNAALVTTDAGCTALYAACFWLLSGQSRSRARMTAVGAVLGLALAAKFSLVVMPAFVAAGLLAERRMKSAPKASAAGVALLAAATAAALALVYCRSGLALFIDGAVNTLSGLSQGRASFMAGRYSTTGHWLYFPLAVLLKTPLPALILAGFAAACWARRPSREFFWVVFPAGAFFAAACASKTQIGYRHVLPIYPFLIVMAAWSCAWLWRRPAGRAAAAALLLWQAAGAVRAQPFQLAYFNELIGDRDRACDYFVDSNLDWGQDLKTMAAELARRGNPAVFLSYFGSADPSYYGMRYLPIAFISTVTRRDGVVEPPPGGPVLLAVSATNLQGVYFADHGIFAWLKSRRPAFIAGHSMFLYDLTSDFDARERLASLARLSGYPGVADRLPLQYKR